MKWPGVSLALLATLLTANLLGQAGVSVPRRPLPDARFVVDSAEQPQIRVSAIRGLSHPWSLTFLPGGEMLVTERPGRLRIVRNGVLDPKPIAGVPTVHAVGLAGLMDIALHPKFSETQLVYLSFSKPMGGGRHTSALVRGRLQGMALVDVREIFVADAVGDGPAAGNPIVFGRDGYLYMGVGGAVDDVAQKTSSHFGKMVRLRDDGSVPPDNPFVGRPEYKPEIYSLGHRNMLGLTVHPATGAIWENENGPLGGDEVNILEPGANYGLASGDVRPPVQRRESVRSDFAQRLRGSGVDLGAVDRGIGHDVLYRRSLPELEEQPVCRGFAVRRHSWHRSVASNRLQ